MKNKIALSILLNIAFVAASFGATETYVADPAHSSVEFKISHFFSKVTGRFQKFTGSVTIDRADMTKSTLKADVDVSSVDTNQAGRDKHLQSPDFFDAAKFPKMTFESKSWKKLNENEFEVTGDLTLHGVTKPVTLNVKNLGFGKGMKDVEISGWEATGKIKRSEFGMTSGAPAVGDEVEIGINVEAKKE
jgi:polyisoprenoid-binding protein YceI